MTALPRAARDVRVPGFMEPTFGIVESARPGHLYVCLWGVIDEFADLEPLTRLHDPEVHLDLERIRRINSFGVKTWIDALRRIPRSTRLIFLNCPPPIIDQCNMVIGFLGHGNVESFYAPMLCEHCDEQLDRLVTTEECRSLGGKLPETSCPRCQRIMEIDDLEEQYLFFVREG